MSRAGMLRVPALRIGRTLVAIGCFALAWQYGARLAHIPEYVLPVPSTIAARFAETFSLQMYHLGVTGLTTLIGLVLALGIGILMALVVVYVPVLKSLILPVLAAFNSIPKIAIGG